MSRRVSQDKDRARTQILRRYWPVFFIFIFTFILRGFTFGDPVLELDEQLYLLVGDRMLQGQLPYVDLWDRKPIGLFLFYACTRLLGGDGIIQYQVVVTFLVAVTATIVWVLSRRSVGNIAATVVALSYVLFLNPLHGTGGQSPVIYNVLTAAAAWACVRSNDIKDTNHQTRLGLFAMLLMGISIQFKYTPLVEGVFFGCYFLHRLHRSGMPFAKLTIVAGVMIVLAVVPTLAAITYFWSIGELTTFAQANFFSIFERNPFPAITRSLQQQKVLFIGGSLILLMPFAAWYRWQLRAIGKERDFIFFLGWSVAALCGFGMLGDFFDFYFITALPPLLVLAAPLLQRGRLGFAMGCLILIWPFIISPPRPGLAAERRIAMQRLVAAVRPLVLSRCLYVYDGPTVIYTLTNACASSRYIYPDHLNNPVEAPALGVDPVAEVARILASRPGAIITADESLVPHVTAESRQHLKQVLAQKYILVARVKLDRTYDVYGLRALIKGRQPLAVPYIDPV